MKITFKILSNGEVVRSHSWENGVYRVGRSEFCDLVIEDDNISRSHLEVRVTDSGCYVTNMSSAGNMRVNSQPLETAELADGDVVGIGAHQLLIVWGDPALDALSPPGIESAADSDDDPEPVIDRGWNLGGRSEVAAGPDDERESGPKDLPEPGSGAAAPGGTSFIDPNPLREATAYPTEGTSALRSETMVESKPVVAKIVFTEGPKRGVELFLDAYEVTLGRSKKADVFLDDEKLSRFHAKITRIGTGYRLIDLSSRNGTFVNGVRILEHPLASFDSIEIGHSKIQFLIHDMASVDLKQVGMGSALPMADTKSLQLIVNPEYRPAHFGVSESVPPPAGPIYPPSAASEPERKQRSNPLLAIVVVVGGSLIVWSLLTSPEPATVKPVPAPVTDISPIDLKLPANIPREFTELSPENQRAVEGYYNSTLVAAEKAQWEDALWNLKKIRELISYYKQSTELTESYTKRLKERQLEETQKKAAQNEQTDLARYNQEGIDYLKEGSFDLAADAFNQAITIDPTNSLAKMGLRAAEYKVRDIKDLPLERDPEKDKKQQVADLFQTALTALQNKSYQEAIDAGDKIRTIELKGDLKYLNEAKIVIDRARLLQKEEFEPFLVEAKGKFAEGDYNASRDLCDEMLKRDPAYDEAKECLIRAKKQLNRLAKENYTTGYVLESMNRIEEAKQYWNRAKNFVRPGDPYYDKVMKKLDDYQ